jgi:hypothetical protein
VSRCLAAIAASGDCGPCRSNDGALFDQPFVEDALPGTVELLKDLLGDLFRGLGVVVLLLRLEGIKLVDEQAIVFADWVLWFGEERGDGDGERQVRRQMQRRRTIVHPRRRESVAAAVEFLLINVGAILLETSVAGAIAGEPALNSRRGGDLAEEVI